MALAVTIGAGGRISVLARSVRTGPSFMPRESASSLALSRASLAALASDCFDHASAWPDSSIAVRTWVIQTLVPHTTQPSRLPSLLLVHPQLIGSGKSVSDRVELRGRLQNNTTKNKITS